MMKGPLTNRAILLVEDNPSDVDLTKRAFEKRNLVNTLVVVRDGQEALDYLFGVGAYAGRDVADVPACILLDLKLPKVDGVTVLQTIKSDARTRMIPVIVLTSSNEPRDIKACYGLGTNSYIRKPVDFDEFVEAVSHLGLYWLVLNEPPPMA
ncbi:MAG: response regulator [Polyangia bacterium]|jgi:two-component system response regulator